MRCLTLADDLGQQGEQVSFICRHLPDYLAVALKNKGHRLLMLRHNFHTQTAGDLAHAHWLGTSQQSDATECMQLLGYQQWDWLIVDHYALDARWELALSIIVKKIMVIDDLADRQHECDVLLDQNLYNDQEHRYKFRVPSTCKLLLGPSYALLRPQFLEARAKTSPRGADIRRIFVFFGGSDLTNETQKSLMAIAALDIPDVWVDVVIGASNLNYETIKEFCKSLSRVRIHYQVDNIAQLMLMADLALGASGSTTWERCALGLPALVISVAHNQVAIAEGVDKIGAHRHLGLSKGIHVEHLTAAIKEIYDDPEVLHKMSSSGWTLVDAKGCERVVSTLKERA